jgi:hypothetical protein
MDSPLNVVFRRADHVPDLVPHGGADPRQVRTVKQAIPGGGDLTSKVRSIRLASVHGCAPPGEREPPSLVEDLDMGSIVRIVSVRAVELVQWTLYGVTTRAAQGGPGV